MTLEGTRYFHEPVSKYVPELQIEYSPAQAKDKINYIVHSFDMLPIRNMVSSSTSLAPTDPTLIGSSVWAPTALSEDPTFSSKAEELTSKLNEAIEDGSLPGISGRNRMLNGPLRC
jgi:hypothetical protein